MALHPAARLSSLSHGTTLPSALHPAPPPAVHIEIEVLVPHESQRRIVIGAGGGTIAGVCEGAQRELEEAWGHPVRLHLRVKADKA